MKKSRCFVRRKCTHLALANTAAATGGRVRGTVVPTAAASPSESLSPASPSSQSKLAAASRPSSLVICDLCKICVAEMTTVSVVSRPHGGVGTSTQFHSICLD